MTAYSVLGGTLLRDKDGSWRWSDGTPEPRVRDLTVSEWNFRCRTYGGGDTYVEVLRGVAQETPALAWVLDGARDRRDPTAESGDHTGPLVIDDHGGRRAHIRPGEDPLCGHEPMPEAPGPIPTVILVPVAEWDAWVRAHPAGAIWARGDEPEILRRAGELGGRWNCDACGATGPYGEPHRCQAED